MEARKSDLHLRRYSQPILERCIWPERVNCIIVYGLNCHILHIGRCNFHVLFSPDIQSMCLNLLAATWRLEPRTNVQQVIGEIEQSPLTQFQIQFPSEHLYVY